MTADKLEERPRPAAASRPPPAPDGDRGSGAVRDQGIEVIRARLRRARRTWRSADIADAVLRGLVILLAAFLAALALDNLLHLPGVVRMALGAAFVAAAVYFLGVRVIRRLTRRLTDEMVAAHVERTHPGLDNYLINAILLHKERFDDPITRGMVASQLGEAARAAGACDVAASTSREGLRKWGGLTIALCAAALLYGLLFSHHFGNALRRYVHPQQYIAPITAIRLTVTPGNAELLQGETLVVEARAEAVKDFPEKAAVCFDDGKGEVVQKAMTFEGGCFSCELTDLQRSFHYWVNAGDFTSDRYTATVRARPGIREIKLTQVYPDYMKLPDVTETSKIGNIAAPVGSLVRLEAVADKPISSASLSINYLQPGESELNLQSAQNENEEKVSAKSAEPVPDSDRGSAVTPLSVIGGQTVRGEIRVTRSGQYQINVKDVSSVPNQPILAQLAALPDDPPVVRVIAPAKDVTVGPDAIVTVLAEAKDDFSLQKLTLFIQRGADKEWEKFKSWSYASTSKTIREGAPLDLKALGLGSGSVLSYYFQGNDGQPGRDAAEGRSRAYQIVVVDADAARREAEERLEALRAVITRLIAMQKKNLAATDELINKPQISQIPQIENGRKEKSAKSAESAVPLDPSLVRRAGPLVKAEEEIYSTAVETVRAYADSAEADMTDTLSSITRIEIARAVQQLEAARSAAGQAVAPPALSAAAATEETVVTLLEKLLKDPQALAKERQKELPKTKVAEQEEALRDSKQRAERLLASVNEFVKEQGDVIQMSKQIKDTPVNDFTKGDEEMLGKIAQTELKWAKYFQELATDLSKLPPQDFSLANQAKELDEIFADVQKAADAANQKTVELAVPLEQGGLELAKNIETNIEKWLMESPDRVAWKQEDAVQDYDVPLAELPAELEDLIGDLMEEEKDLLDDAADATSGWLDSMDKGVGWGTADGPISDMSAKGVTGNVLPDSQEVGGRSGEGRTGKSSGQYVQETASGKGGRNTPTRLTQDPFESGSVKDTSSEPATGSTGGGKLSGAGQEGLQGPVPPPVRGELKRVAQLQQQLIDKAKSLDYGLKKYNYPRGELPKTIELMQQVKTDIEQADIPTAAATHRVVLSNLREVKDIISQQKKLTRDNSALLPKELRDEIAASASEEVPQEYRELVNGYFRALSEAGSAPTGAAK